MAPTLSGYFCLALVIYLQVIHLVLGVRPYTIKIQSYRYEVNPSFVQECTFKLISYKNHQAVNGSVKFTKDIDDFETTFTAYVPKARGRPWTLLNITTDGCKLLGGGVGTKSLNLLSALVKNMRASNPYLPEECPLKKDKEISLLNFFVNPDIAPPTLPDMKLNIVVAMHKRNTNIFTNFITAEVASKNGRKMPFKT